jgi:hypothetical protein
LIQQLSQFKELGRDVIVEKLKENQWDVDGAMLGLFKCLQVQREEQERKRREEQQRKLREEQERKVREVQEQLRLEQIKKKEEIERKMKEEQERLRLEQERKIKEEMRIREDLKRQEELKFKVEQERKAREEHERSRLEQERARFEQERLRLEQLKMKEEHERKIREDHERKIREEQERQRLELERLRLEQERREEIRLKEENERKFMEERLKLEKILKEQEERKREEIKRKIMEDKLSRQKQAEDPIEPKIQVLETKNQTEKPMLYPLEGRMNINPLEASSIDFVHIGDSKPKPNDIVVKLIAKPEHVDCCEQVNVIVEHTGQPNSTDWIGLYPNEDCSDKEYLTYIWVTQDTRSFTIKAPSKPGTYVFKYFVSVNKSSSCWAYSNPFRVGPAYRLTPTILGTLQVSIKAEQTYGSHSSSAWIAMYEPDKDNKKYSGNYQYIGDKKEFFFVAPKFGRWEFRIFPTKEYVHTDSVFVDLN